MDNCPNCWKTPELCICDRLPRLENRVKVLILQHPQEPDKDLGSARLCNLILANSRLKTGFSAPNLAAALGAPADPARWIVLYLGSKYKFRQTAEQAAGAGQSELAFFNRKDETVSLPAASIEGVVVLDGTWAQAKAIWWRNPWLVKLTRAAVLPRRRSLYGRLRREPRQECVSTIEAVAYTLEALGEAPALPEALLAAFGELLERYGRTRRAGRPSAAPASAAPAATSGTGSPAEGPGVRPPAAPPPAASASAASSAPGADPGTGAPDGSGGHPPAPPALTRAQKAAAARADASKL